MTNLLNVQPSDLILRVTGGSRDGELIPVSTPKCYLGMESTNDAIADNPQCAIFRGRDGVVMRSYNKRVMLNDAAASLDWLRKGDTIRFPNKMKFQVVQLGDIKDFASAKGQTSQTSSVDSDLEGTRLVVLESELRSIQLQNEQSKTRFDSLDTRLDELTEKMTMLINLSSDGTGLQVSQSSEVITAPVTSSAAIAAAASVPTEEKIINPLQSESSIQSPTVEVLAAPESSETEPQATEQSSLTSALQSEEVIQSPVTEQSSLTSALQSDEVIQSPLTPSPLAELDRIDKAIEESKSGQYSHTDSSDEQILTFDKESATSEAETTEKVTEEATNAVVTEEQIVASTAASTTVTEPVSTETTEETPASEESAEETEEDAAAKAAAEANALAEKEQRISDMERIFGGALSETDADEADEPATKSEPTTEPTNSVGTAQLETTDSTPSVDAVQPADDQLSKTFEDLAHGQNAEVDPSADNTVSTDSVDSLESIMSRTADETSAPETDSDNSQDVSALSPMAMQLLQEVKAEQDAEPTTETSAFVETESFEAPVSEEVQSSLANALDNQEPAVEMPAMETESVDSEPAAPPKKEGNESVADILARMKEDGKWDGVPSEDGAVDQVESVEPVAEPEPEVEEEVEEETSLDSSEGAGEGEEDVDDYMSQLLSRMRGEEPAEETKVASKKEKKAKKVEKKKAVEPKVEAPVDPLKAEDFKPKHKAKKLKSLAAMREISNSNTRTNVKTSQTQLRKAKAAVQAGVGLVGLIMALCYFFCSKELFDVPFLVGIVCSLLAAICGLVFLKNLVSGGSKGTKTVAQADGSEEEE